jgi:hypothetical protein
MKLKKNIEFSNSIKGEIEMEGIITNYKPI